MEVWKLFTAASNEFSKTNPEISSAYDKQCVSFILGKSDIRILTFYCLMSPNGNTISNCQIVFKTGT